MFFIASMQFMLPVLLSRHMSYEDTNEHTYMHSLLNS